MMEIVINQNENQNIIVENENNQNINITQNEKQDINIKNKLPQKLNIEQEQNQAILIDGGGNIIGINDVLVNGVSVVSGNIAYVIVPTKLSELQNDMEFLTNENDPTVPSYVKAITLADINNWNNKQNNLVSGSNIKTINNESLLGSGNIEIEGTIYTAGTGISITDNIITNEITSYDNLTDLPTIPTNTSQLINDSDYVISSDLSDVAFSGSYTDLSNLPDIPTDTSDLINDSGFIDKNVNDLTYYTLTSNLSTVATTGDYNDLNNLPFIPTKTSDLSNDSGFINNTVNNLTNYTLTSNLSTVAISGDYDDLLNKPTIPTVNDATLTIQKNGSTIDTFTANSSTNKTVNITIPTQTSELTNNSGYIDKNVNDLTYYMTTTNINNNLNNKANEYFSNGYIFDSGNEYLYITAIFQPPTINATIFLTNKIPSGKKLTMTGNIRLFASNNAPISSWVDITTLSPTLYYIPDTNIVRINLTTSLSGNWQSAALNISNGSKIKMEDLT